MKIEDLYYSLSALPVDEKNFDLVKWEKENPIDYFKFLFILFQSDQIDKTIPEALARQVAFNVIYKTSRLYIPNTLYKFYSLTEDKDLNEKKLETLQNKKIYMSDIEDFNDPFDSKAFYYDPARLKKIKRLASHGGRLIDDFTAILKTTSLTENDVNSLPMWAHYSNNHHGFCIAYDMKNPYNTAFSACTFKVQYTDQRLDISSFMEKYVGMTADLIEKQQAQGKKQILISDLSIAYFPELLSNVKHESWQYEKEYRCTMGAKSEGMPYVDAMPKEIYIGMKCLPQYAFKLNKIAKKLHIPVYQMKFDELSEEYKLNARKGRQCFL